MKTQQSIRHLPIKEQIKRLYKLGNKQKIMRKAHLTRSIIALKKYCSDNSIHPDLKYKQFDKSISNVIKNKDNTEIELVIDVLKKFKSSMYSQKNKYIDYVINILHDNLT